MIYLRKPGLIADYFCVTEKKTRCLLLAFFTFFSLLSFSFPPPGNNSRGFRFLFGPSIGFYSINTNHARIGASKPSAIIGFRKEISLDKTYQNFFLIGADYFFHGLNFKSYYFKKDSLKLYDKNFDYNYSLFISEVHVPFQMKHSFTRENNSLFSPYVMIGYHLRVLLPANVNVTQNGNSVSRKWEELSFRHPLISNKINCFVSASAGWQKNPVNNSRAGFFVEVNYRLGFSQYYIHPDYAANSLFMNGSHLSLLLGVNF